MPSSKYLNAVLWVAINDSAGDNEPAEQVADYLTVLLIADVFGSTPRKVADDVIRARAHLARVQAARS